MKSRLWSCWVVRSWIALILALAPAAGWGSALEYRVTELSPLPDRFQVAPWKINDRGDILGMGWDSMGRPHPFIYHNGVARELIPSGDMANAIDINDAGQIICYVFAPEGGGYGVLISPEGRIVNLDNLFKTPTSPLAINDAGEILTISGFGLTIYNISTGNFRSLVDPRTVNASDLNNLGQVVGYFTPEDGSQAVGTLFDPTGVTHFRLPGKNFTVPTLINNQGLIAGIAYDDNENFKPLPFTYEEGHFKPIPPLDGDAMAAPSGINDQGDIVGWSAGSIQRGFLYRAGHMEDLNSLIAPQSDWFLDWGMSINNKGQIVGTGTFRNGQRGFLLTPVRKHSRIWAPKG